MENRRKRHDGDDVPVFSRLFVVCGKNIKEDDLREPFSKFGTIENFFFPQDYNTGQSKGIAFVKFSKTSEAASALENMHMKCLPNNTRPIKVMVAANRSEIQSEDDDFEKYKRLFINAPTSATDEELSEYFSQFGPLESVIIQKHRDTLESKGFAYIKYRSFFHAAKAFEECDKKYRAIFAQPKGYQKRTETSFESNINTLSAAPQTMKNSLIPMMNVNPEGYTSVNIQCSPFLTYFHIRRIFDIIPGMIDCRFEVDYRNDMGKGTVTYSSPVSAAYAVQKLDYFEYPPGHQMFVTPDFRSLDSEYQTSIRKVPNAVSKLKSAVNKASNSSTPDLAQLAEAISEATKLVKLVTSGLTDQDIPDSKDLNYCSATLPPPQPLADIDSPVAKRCFLVCKPQPPPIKVLRDVFCRFGNLINVYTLPNKTVGYARYATTQSADEAISVLHGAEICGVRIKVLEAEDEDKATHKRRRYDD